jgi:hypothetical protein
MAIYFRICLLALLAFASLVASVGTNPCKEIDVDISKVRDIGPKFHQKDHDDSLAFKAVSRDGTIVKVTKKIFKNDAKNVVSIHNKKLGGRTSIAITFNHVENGKVIYPYVRWFRVRNGTPACAVDSSKWNGKGKEVVTKVSYFTV